jgi:hypothetical protein
MWVLYCTVWLAVAVKIPAISESDVHGSCTGFCGAALSLADSPESPACFVYPQVTHILTHLNLLYLE